MEMNRREGGLLLLSLAAAMLLAGAASGGDALWRIVSDCLDSATPDYCSRCISPVEDSCGPARDCRSSTQIWAETDDYVAIRDLKMCGCAPGFVHGLALPRTRVSGIEDPRRPTAVWAFAWDVARARIPDEQEVALVVNPRSRRTQDQLHVHMVRLAPGARARIVGAVAISAIGEVWEAAARAAAAAKLDDYGVLVVRDGVGSGFLVMVDPNSLEEALTIGTCRR